MKSKILALALLSSIALPAFAADSSAKPKPVQKVEINLGPGLLSFAAKIASVKDPAAGEIIKGLRNLKTKVYDFKGVERTAALEQIVDLRKSLVDGTWNTIVTVADQENNDVTVMVKQGSNDTIEGLVITVLDPQQQGVIVQIDGTLQPDQIASVVKHLNIDGVPGLHCEKPEKS